MARAYNPFKEIHASYIWPLFIIKEFKECITVAKKKLKGIEFDAFAVTGNSGTLFGGALAIAMKKELILVRKDDESSHASYKIEGNTKLKTFIFLDDFVSSGTTEKRVLKKIRESSYFGHLVYVGTYQWKDEVWNEAPDDLRTATR